MQRSSVQLRKTKLVEVADQSGSVFTVLHASLKISESQRYAEVLPQQQ